MNIYDFTVKAQDGSDVNLADFKDKVILVVNTATGCGFTPQYEGLQDLYEKYNAKDFEILDFPCNQFGEQAPGDGLEGKGSRAAGNADFEIDRWKRTTIRNARETA